MLLICDIRVRSIVDLRHKGDCCRKSACGSAPLLQKKVKKVVAKAGVRGDVARLGNGDGLERVINGDGDGVGGDSVPLLEASVSPELKPCFIGVVEFLSHPVEALQLKPSHCC
ncbi:hypothetical protein Droror1_Dr00022682 [Drosera rotundifolia]